MGGGLKALVTGATGFIGGALCRELCARGWQVRALRRENSLTTLINGLPVEQVIGDLTQPETIENAVKGVDVVFHNGALLGGRSNLALALQVTVGGTRIVAEAARKAGARRMVHMSSVAALGAPMDLPQGVGPMILDETHTWNLDPTQWAYGYAKYLAEMEIQKAVVQGLDAVIVNPTIVIGAGDVYRQTSSIIQKVSRGRLRVSVDGGFNVIHIDDVVDGILAAYERGITGERYILGNLNVTITDYLKTIARVTGGEPPSLVLPGGLVLAGYGVYRLASHFLDLPVEPELLHQAGRFFYFSHEKASRQLAWEPKRTIENAIREAHDWFQLPLSPSVPEINNGEGLQSSK